jgi:hypothetical protein
LSFLLYGSLIVLSICQCTDNKNNKNNNIIFGSGKLNSKTTINIKNSGFLTSLLGIYNTNIFIPEAQTINFIIDVQNMYITIFLKYIIKSLINIKQHNDNYNELDIYNKIMESVIYTEALYHLPNMKDKTDKSKIATNLSDNIIEKLLKDLKLKKDNNDNDNDNDDIPISALGDNKTNIHSFLYEFFNNPETLKQIKEDITNINENNKSIYDTNEYVGGIEIFVLFTMVYSIFNEMYNDENKLSDVKHIKFTFCWKINDIDNINTILYDYMEKFNSIENKKVEIIKKLNEIINKIRTSNASVVDANANTNANANKINNLFKSGVDKIFTEFIIIKDIKDINDGNIAIDDIFCITEYLKSKEINKINKMVNNTQSSLLSLYPVFITADTKYQKEIVKSIDILSNKDKGKGEVDFYTIVNNNFIHNNFDKEKLTTLLTLLNDKFKFNQVKINMLLPSKTDFDLKEITLLECFYSLCNKCIYNEDKDITFSFTAAASAPAAAAVTLAPLPAAAASSSSVAASSSSVADAATDETKKPTVDITNLIEFIQTTELYLLLYSDSLDNVWSVSVTNDACKEFMNICKINLQRIFELYFKPYIISDVNTSNLYDHVKSINECLIFIPYVINKHIYISDDNNNNNNDTKIFYIIHRIYEDIFVKNEPLNYAGKNLIKIFKLFKINGEMFRNLLLITQEKKLDTKNFIQFLIYIFKKSSNEQLERNKDHLRIIPLIVYLIKHKFRIMFIELINIILTKIKNESLEIYFVANSVHKDILDTMLNSYKEFNEIKPDINTKEVITYENLRNALMTYFDSTEKKLKNLPLINTHLDNYKQKLEDAFSISTNNKNNKYIFTEKSITKKDYTADAHYLKFGSRLLKNYLEILKQINPPPKKK